MLARTNHTRLRTRRRGREGAGVSFSELARLRIGDGHQHRRRRVGSVLDGARLVGRQVARVPLIQHGLAFVGDDRDLAFEDEVDLLRGGGRCSAPPVGRKWEMPIQKVRLLLTSKPCSGKP